MLELEQRERVEVWEEGSGEYRRCFRTQSIPNKWLNDMVVTCCASRSNFFAMPPTATKPDAPGAANPEGPKFSFGFGAAKK